MRVCIVSAVFPPESPTSARTSADIAEEMTRRGHDVNVVTPFPNRPSGDLYPGYRRRLRYVTKRDGYRVVHTWHTLSKKSTLLSRSIENISFGMTSTIQLLRESSPDVVFMNTWPIFAQWMNSLALSLRRIPIVCAVKDLYPETVFNGSGSRGLNRQIARLVKAVDRQTMRRSRVVAPLNDVMAEYITTSRKIDAAKVQVVPDWVDGSTFSRASSNNGEFRAKHAFSSDQFLAMYVGGMSRMAGLDLYVEAAKRLRHRKDISVLLVGDGAMRAEIESTIHQQRLDNIRMIYPLQPTDVPDVQAAADVLMLSLLPGAAEHATPSKLIYYMFSQRPIIASVKEDSPAARVIGEANCGHVIGQGDAEALARKLEEMADDSANLEKLGVNAGLRAQRRFSKQTIVPQVCDLLERIGE